MSILDKIRGANWPFENSQQPPKVGSDLEQRIADVQDAITEAQGAHQTALGAWAVDPSLHEAVVATEATLIEAKKHLKRLNDAKAAKAENDAKAERARYLEIRRSQRHASLMHMRSREKAAARVTEILANLKIEVDALIASSRRAANACPKGSVWPGIDAQCSPEQLMMQISWELWRTFPLRQGFIDSYAAREAGKPVDNLAYKFPGIAMPDVVSLGLSPGVGPDQVPPLAERLRQRDDAVIALFANQDGDTPPKSKPLKVAKAKEPERMPPLDSEPPLQPVSYLEAQVVQSRQGGGQEVVGEVPPDFTWPGENK